MTQSHLCHYTERPALAFVIILLGGCVINMRYDMRCPHIWYDVIILKFIRIFCRRTYKYHISYKSFHFRCNSFKDLNFRIHSFTACFKLINNQISLSFKNILTSFSSSISFLLLLYWDGLTNLAKVIIVTPLSVLDPSASAGVDAAWSFLLVMGIIMAS